MPVPTSLATRLRQETRPYHTDAERSGIMRKLLTKVLDQPTYVALLRNLVPVYAALETELSRLMTDPRVAPFYHPGLARGDALAADIAALGDGPAAPPTSAALAYAARIRTAASEDSVLLVAHSYVRYLGDLSGGQILKRMIGEMYGVSDGVGTAFYDFPALPSPEAFKQGYRAALDNIELTEAEQDRVVAEAIAAFSANTALFVALETPASR